MQNSIIVFKQLPLNKKSERMLRFKKFEKFDKYVIFHFYIKHVLNDFCLRVVLWAFCKHSMVFFTLFEPTLSVLLTHLVGKSIGYGPRRLFAHVTSVFGLSQPFEGFSFLKHSRSEVASTNIRDRLCFMTH